MTAVQHDPTAFLLDRISVLERRLHKAYTEVHEQRRRAELWRGRALNRTAGRGPARRAETATGRQEEV